MFSLSEQEEPVCLRPLMFVFCIYTSGLKKRQGGLLYSLAKVLELQPHHVSTDANLAKFAHSIMLFLSHLPIFLDDFCTGVSIA
jgi:hypothetical protein